jgi:hypothetical protein
LTEEQEEFRQAVNRFATDELAPRAQDIDRENSFPMVNFFFSLQCLLLLTRKQTKTPRDMEAHLHFFASSCMIPFSPLLLSFSPLLSPPHTAHQFKK